MNLKRLFLLCGPILMIAACQNQAQVTLPSPSPKKDTPPESTPLSGISLDPFSVDWDDRGIFESGLIQEARPILDELSENTIYQLDWTVSSDLGSLSGEMIIRYTNRENVGLDRLYLRLFPNILGGEMIVTGLSINGDPVDGSLERGDSVLRIELPQTLEPGAQVNVAGMFSIELPREINEESGHYGLFGSFDNFLALEESYPIIAVYDEDGWDIDLPAPHGDLTHLDTSFYIVRIRLPAHLQVVASGVTLDHRIQDQWQTLTVAAGPARDFYLAAGDFQLNSTSYGETTINSYVLPAAESSNDKALLYSKAAIAVINQRLGNYPYTEFDLISSPMLALGMEYPGVVALNMNMYDPEAEISGMPGTNFLEGTIAHEVTHQWYYNLIGNDQLEEPWLDEAIAQFLTGIYFLDFHGEQHFRGYRQSWLDRWERVEQELIPIGLPASDYEGRAYGAVVYGRGPLFVEALAEQMGEQIFWDFLRSFTEEHAWKIAHPESFTSMAEAACACDLTEMWETWGLYP
jgi:hypothetical protein